MKARARVVELRQIPGEAGLPSRFTAYVAFTGNVVVGSATVNVSPDLYHRLQAKMSAGENPELDVELVFEGFR